MQRIHVSGMAFRDEWGRQRIFHGINLVHKGTKLSDGTIDYIGPWTEADFADLARWGFNAVRLGMIWDAVEPQPGKYDEAYLEWILSMLDLCEKYEIHAFLDMHQDLYSASFNDGAPAWATLTGAVYEPTALWSDAYIFSEAVQQAYDAFWSNAPAADGVGLQDHYAAMWAHVARRCGGHAAVMGYDFLNEPNPGSASLAAFGALMSAYAVLRSQAEGVAYTVDDIIAAFNDPEEKLAALMALDDPSFYRRLGELAQEPVRAFDREVLDPFYQRMTQAVRAAGGRGIVFRENSYFSNMGIPCAATPIQGPEGREPQQAFSPHGYDLVVDTEAIALSSNARVDTIFERHREAQLALGVPALVGEWGALGLGEGVQGHARHVLAIFERYLWSHTYWCHQPGIGGAPAMRELCRSYPRAVAGELLAYGNDMDQGLFTMQWKEGDEAQGPSEVYLHRDPREIGLQGAYEMRSNVLFIPATGGQRMLTVRY